jgi:hypothetical protein
MSARYFDSESSSVSPHSIHPLVDEVVVPMQYSTDPTPLLGGYAPLDHVVLQPIQPMVEEVVMPMQSSINPTLLLESVESTKVVIPMKSLDDPTLLLESVESTKVVMLMQYSVDPTLLLESVNSTKVVTPMQYLVDPTLMMGSDVSTDYVFSIFSLVLSEQGGIPLTSSTPPASPGMVSFDLNDLVEILLPSFSPFQIRFEVNSIFFYQCIVDKGASASILSSSAWKALGSLELVSASHELLTFYKHPTEYLGILPHFPISLGGKTVVVNVIVVQGPLEFNMLLEHDYVCAMNVVVSMLFQVMHFPHNRRIVTIDQLASDNHHPNLVLV